MKRRIWDTMPFSNEVDLLEARLTELYDHVHRFVICESPLTYTGLPKPLYYAENKERFAAWADKIIHVVADTSSETSSPARENLQRNTTWQGLGDYGDGDLLIHGDADEIAHPDDLDALAQGTGLGMKVMHRHHPLAVNLLDTTPWGGYVPQAGPRRPQMLELRQRLHSRLIRTRLGKGWHFSWLGGPQAMKTKVTTLLEYEMVPRIVHSAEAYYYGRINPGSGDRDLKLVDIDSSWPRFMQDRKGPAEWYWPGPDGQSAAFGR